MDMNRDYILDEELEKIKKISIDFDLTYGEIGKMCGIKDKGFWSRIMYGKKPVPEHTRTALNKLFKKGE